MFVSACLVEPELLALSFIIEKLIIISNDIPIIIKSIYAQVASFEC